MELLLYFRMYLAVRKYAIRTNRAQFGEIVSISMLNYANNTCRCDKII